MQIREELLSYHDRLKVRDPGSIDLVVIHCTELPDLQTAREFGEKIMNPESGTGFSGHYYIDRDGSVMRYVRDERVAHHVIGHNDRSIGIELVNLGRYPDWYDSRHQVPSDPYPDAQITSLKLLLQYLKSEYPQLMRIARHSDLDAGQIPASDDSSMVISRKIDPGPLFPWNEITAYWSGLL
jgi:N-acetylmuramoyl-L-alanine amidase